MRKHTLKPQTRAKSSLVGLNHKAPVFKMGDTEQRCAEILKPFLSVMHHDICNLTGKVETISLKTFQDLKYCKWKPYFLGKWSQFQQTEY